MFVLVVTTVPFDESLVFVLSEQDEVGEAEVAEVSVRLDEDVVLLFQVVVGKVAVDPDFSHTVDVD